MRRVQHVYPKQQSRHPSAHIASECASVTSTEAYCLGVNGSNRTSLMALRTTDDAEWMSGKFRARLAPILQSLPHGCRTEASRET